MTLAIIDMRADAECEEELNRRGFTVLRIKPCKNLPVATASHPDMQMFYHADTIITTRDSYEANAELYEKIRALIPSIKITVSEEALSNAYPYDAILNALCVGDTLLCRTESVCRDILSYAVACGMRVVSTRQGYPCCTVLALNEKNAVCADEGMARIMQSVGIRTYRIENGDISLPPYEYGFIGGACGVYNDTVYFFGDVDTHRCASIIKRAVEDCSMKYVCLCTSALFDFGKIIFINDGLEQNDK